MLFRAAQKLTVDERLTLNVIKDHESLLCRVVVQESGLAVGVNSGNGDLRVLLNVPKMKTLAASLQYRGTYYKDYCIVHTSLWSFPQAS